MILEILKDFKQIGGHKIAHMDQLKKQFPEMVAEDGQTLNWKFFEEKIRPTHPIQMRQDKQSLSFTFGKDACSLSTVIFVLFELVAHKWKDDHEYIGVMHHLKMVNKGLLHIEEKEK